jgi:hypothetical protein
VTVWFYRSADDATVKGPVSPSELLELIRKGIVRENTQVRKGESPWVSSIDVGGLWEAAARPSVVFDCPHCSKRISKPPVRCPHCKQFVQKATGHLVHHKTVAPDRKNRSESSSDSHGKETDRFGSQPGLYD